MPRLLERKILYILSGLSGLILSLSFLNCKLEWFAWLGLVPLLIVIEKEKDYRSLAKESILSGLVFFGISLWWLHFVTLMGFVVVVSYLSLYFLVFGLTLNFLYKKKIITSLSQLFLIPSIWILVEYLRSHLFTGFGWVSLGYSQHENISFIQIADITGVYGVSFLIVLVNIILKEIILNFKSILIFDKEKIKKITYIFSIGLISFILVYAYGDIKLNKISSGCKIKASVIQGNILQHQKWNPFYENIIMEKYKKITGMASRDNPDIIVWPETSLPNYLNEYETFREITELVRDKKTPLLIGAVRIDKDAGEYYNSACLILEDGTIQNVYDKIHLVPFGEYIPFHFIFGFLEGRVETADFTKGKIYTIFNVKDSNFGVLICFEDAFSDLVRNFVRRGADFMVNMTNDAWFKDSSEPDQHLACSVFRAVENRVNIIRAANTGISSFIDPSGKVISKVSSGGKDTFVEGYKTCFLEIEKRRTIYTNFGDVFVMISLIVAIGYITKSTTKK